MDRGYGGAESNTQAFGGGSPLRPPTDNGGFTSPQDTNLLMRKAMAMRLGKQLN